MKIKMSLMITCVSMGLLLAGCSAKRGPGGVPVTNATYGGATTMGYGSDTGFQGGATVPANCTQAPANQSYYFDLNSSDVHSQLYPCINTQGKYLSKNRNAKVRLEGNCDNRGSREYNRALGWRRAKAVKSVLMQNGVSSDQVTTFSWGSEKATPGAGEAVWSKDRRVDLVYKGY